MLSTGPGLKDLTGNVHIDTLECRNLSATNFAIDNLNVNTSLLPTVDNAVDLGSSAKRFKRAYVNDIDLGVTRASKQLKTDASGVVAFDPLLSVGTGNGLTLNSGTQVLDLALASGSGSGAITSSTYNDIVANTAARHNAVTLGTSNGLSLLGQQLSLQTATTSVPGAASAALVTDVNANTAARHAAVTLGTSNGLSLAGQQISLGTASASTTGALTSTDWNTFNGKQPLLFTTTSLPFENRIDSVFASPPYSFLVSNHLSVNGRTGIGLTGYDSAAKLHVRDTTSGVRAVLDVNAAAYTGASVGLWFGNTASNYPYAQIDGIDGQPLINQVFLGDLAFKTNTNQTMNERMRIKASGNIGIGTASPGALLQIGAPVDVFYSTRSETLAAFGSAGSQPSLTGAALNGTAVLYSNDAMALNRGSSLAFAARHYNFGGGEGHMIVGRVSGVQQSGATSYGGDLVFETHQDSTAALYERMRIKASGRVGMGTGDPARCLHVASNDIQLRLSGSDTNKILDIGYDTTNNFSYLQCVQIGVANRPLCLNKDGGAVSIQTTETKGTTQIGSTSHVPSAGGGAVPGLVVNSNASSWVALDAGPPNTGNRVVMGNISNQATIGGHNDPFNLWTDLVINPSTDGRVGVGTFAPTHKFHVSGDVNVSAGTYRRDGQAIQNVVPGVRTGAMNLAQIPFYTVWQQLFYIDIPYAGQWKCSGSAQFAYHCNSAWFEMSWSTTSAAMGVAANTQTFHTPNISNQTVYYGVEAILVTTGPQRVYLNGRVGVFTGAGDFIINGGQVAAYRLV
jgi:hypothetical protein